MMCIVWIAVKVYVLHCKWIKLVRKPIFSHIIQLDTIEKVQDVIFIRHAVCQFYYFRFIHFYMN
ncbi:unknown [Prevotella sp. CAG:1185]|nr:unknown [Prevotella sp. CAG:1185]